MPSFTVLLDNGAVFSNVPAHRLRTKMEVSKPISDDELTYTNSGKGPVEITKYESLKNCKVMFPKSNNKIDGVYELTIEWIEDNLLLHLINLSNGQIVLMPSHKILFNEHHGEFEIPRYKKLRHEFMVGKS